MRDLLKRRRDDELSSLEEVCHHCFHSVKGLPFRWQCCGCGDTAMKCLYDYYIDGKRNTPPGVQDMEDIILAKIASL